MIDITLTELISSIDKLRNLSITREDLKAVKMALDKIFTVVDSNSKCTNFVYTLNTDKIPFGCIVFPILKPEDINNFFIVGEPITIHEYEIELDSKVFDYGLTNEQVAAIMLYNIYHMLKDKHHCDNVREAIDDFFVKEGKNLIIRDSVEYQSILLLGLVDALTQMTSCLNLPEDIVSDPFLDSLELTDWVEGLHKLYKEIPGCHNEILRQPKLSILYWCLRLYDNVEKERIPALRLLDKVKKITASVLYNNRFDAATFALHKIDTDAVVTETVKTVLTESGKRFKWLANLRYSGLRNIENDLYTFYHLSKNSNSENDIMYCLKQINARLSILDDYIRNNQDDPELDRWIKVKSDYYDLRDEVAKKKLKSKTYGIFVDYDQLDAIYDRQ